MSIEKILLDEAAHMADSLEGGVAALEAELVAIEQRRIETEAELKAAKLARTRLLDTACSPWQLLADCLAYEIKLCNGITASPVRHALVTRGSFFNFLSRNAFSFGESV